MSVRDFRVDLADPAACGVYFVAPEDIAVVRAAADPENFNLHHVDLVGCRDRATFALRLAAGLSLPARYGQDWRSLVDYLERMEGIPSRGHIILITHPDEWHTADPDGMSAALDALEETAVIWAGEGVAFFVFVPQDAHEAAITNAR